MRERRGQVEPDKAVHPKIRPEIPGAAPWPVDGEFRSPVIVCPRCGGEHFGALWTPLPKPKTFLDHQFTHSSRCPLTGEPLFMESRIR